MQFISAATLVVPDYASAIDFYVGQLGWTLLEDVDQGAKRWVTISPPGGQCRLVLARADGAAQTEAVGNQTGGRVGFFLTTDDFARDHAAMIKAGVRFREEPRHENYGSVAVWEDPFGNTWDLIQPTTAP